MTGWSLQNVWMQVLERRDGFARVLYDEHDLTQPDFLTARIHGWLPLDTLASRQRRAFVHVVATRDTPARWQHASDADGFSTCEPFWAPLTPRPSLVAGQDEWLAAFHEALVHAVAALDT
jgi:nicotinamidase-related amidase